MRPIAPIELLCRAADSLGPLVSEVVFIGGAVLGLLVTESGSQSPRFTNDVDVVIEVSGTLLDDLKLNQQLLDLGFQNDMAGPTCRYLRRGTVVDVIPVSRPAQDPENRWYELVISTAQLCPLPNGITIKLVTPTCFLATKLTAFRSATRDHHDDVFLSRDFGDVIRLIDGRPSIAHEVMESQEDLRQFLQTQFEQILNDPYINEAISEHLEPGREELVLARIRLLLGEKAH